MRIYFLQVFLLILLTLVFVPIRFTFADDQREVAIPLDISSEQECESISGSWNTCPPNECQQTTSYKNGEIVCPQVCGQPRCEGIVPVEEGDLSEVHNPSVYEEREQDIDKSVPNDAQTPVDNYKPTDTSKPIEEIKADFQDVDRTLILLVILGIALLGVYYVINKSKIKNQKSK